MSSPSLLRRVGVAGSVGSLATGSVAVLLTTLAATPAAAGTNYVVDDASDGPGTSLDCITPVVGSCSLRDAIKAAGPGDTITFAAGITSITLTEGALDMSPVSIIGPGSDTLTITTTAGPGSYQIFYIGGATGDVTISGLTLTKNGIYTENDGDFTLDDVVIEDSRNIGSSGGALYARNDGDVLITNSHFSRNASNRGGGAIYAENQGAVSIYRCSFDDNEASSGGAIGVSGDVVDLSLESSTLTGNIAIDYGGGVYALNNGNVFITDSVLDGNETHSGGGGGGAYLGHDGNTTVTRTSIINNIAGRRGGGLYVLTPGKELTIVSSLIAGNSAILGGGGLFLKSSVDATIANTTITGNESDSIGGGIVLNGANDLQLLQATITDNTANLGGGVYAGSSSTVFMSGSILSGNTKSAAPDDIYTTDTPPATFNSTHSIIGTVNSNVTITDDAGTIRTDDPGVEALADNGGPTKTMALSATSPALDAGPATVATFPDNQYDQRGIGYARVVNGKVDIGAFEVQAAGPGPDPGPGPEPVVPSFTG